MILRDLFCSEKDYTRVIEKKDFIVFKLDTNIVLDLIHKPLSLSFILRRKKN
jgi:hypothetical protein